MISGLAVDILSGIRPSLIATIRSRRVMPAIAPSVIPVL